MLIRFKTMRFGQEWVHPHLLNLDTVFQRYDGRRASLDAGLEFILRQGPAWLSLTSPEGEAFQPSPNETLELWDPSVRNILHALWSAGKVEPRALSASEFLREVYSWPVKKTLMQKSPLD